MTEPVRVSAARPRRALALPVVVLVAAGGLAAAQWLGRGGVATPTAAPTVAPPTAARGPATPATPATPTPAAPPGASGQPATGWTRGVSGAGWRLTLPDDPTLRPTAFGTMQMWLAGDADRLRGVVAGPLDVAAGATLDDIAARVEAELAMIPSGGAVSALTRVTLPAGEAVTLTRTIGATAFRAWALRLGGRAFRLMIAGYDDATAGAVAASLAVAP